MPRVTQLRNLQSWDPLKPGLPVFKAQAFNHYIRLQFDIYLYTKKALSLEMENKIVSKLGLFLFEVSGKIFIILKLAIIN